MEVKSSFSFLDHGRFYLSSTTYGGKDIGMIFQDPLTALNPLMTVGKQIEESMDYHTCDMYSDPYQTPLRVPFSSFCNMIKNILSNRKQLFSRKFLIIRLILFIYPENKIWQKTTPT
ncbi:hypothetical protein ACPF7I_05935 [Anoxybacillus sp. D401a]|uniref:hypothetical protein n=1 Tax=Anoxybacillus sp. D401a TaxID=575112 RepID=UPI003D32B6F3